MPEWSSKSQVEKALKKARKKAADMRSKHGGHSAQFQDALRDCVAIQNVLDRWGAINS